MTVEATTTTMTHDDRALLRRFEPVLRFTRGECFLPMDVETYVRHSSLWVQRPQEFPLRLWDHGSLTLERLVEPRLFPFGSVPYLKFVEPLNATEMAARRLRSTLAPDEDRFNAGRGRLSRVGYASRFVDAIFSLSLLLRGRVPGDTAVAAVQAYRQLQEQNRACRYYGRVLRRDGWIILQYWFFYAFNNWRSGYNGANDHEADWEMICVYLYETEGGAVAPEWVAYASHDFSGDDLRRRWDDPEVEKIGEHPVIYVGAGSHASYFQRGEYLAEVELPFLAPAQQFVDRLQELWWRIFPNNRQPSDTRWSQFSLFRVPFVDYARGDGRTLGPEQPLTWAEPGLLAPAPEWVAQYRGLWGLYTNDPFSGEDAPAGPMYNRDGTVRRAWYDPLGWAGLDKVPAPQRRLLQLRHQQDELEATLHELQRQIEEKSQELVGLGVELDAMRGRPYLEPMRDAHRERVAAASQALHRLRAECAAQETLLDTLRFYERRVRAGERVPLRAHVRRPHHSVAEQRPLSRFGEAWTALSIGLLLIGLVLIVLFARQYVFVSLTLLVSLMVFIEAGVRGNLARLITSVTTALAFVAALVILYEFFWQIAVISVFVAGAYIMWDNLRELRH